MIGFELAVSWTISKINLPEKYLIFCMLFAAPGIFVDMVQIHHLNCLKIVTPIADNVIGHCLLLQQGERLVLIDAGIGLIDTKDPEKRIGRDLIEMAGFRFHEELTAVRQIEKLGLKPQNVTDIVVSHMDPDHIGALADFPNAVVHVGKEEFENFSTGNPRYLVHQLDHDPKVITYSAAIDRWMGFEARKVNVKIDAEIFLIPLFGHTKGHCGVVINHNDNMIFYSADAYYLRAELTESNHPVNELATIRADDNYLRLQSLEKIRQFIRQHPDVMVFCYHDWEEFPKTVKT